MKTQTNWKRTLSNISYLLSIVFLVASLAVNVLPTSNVQANPVTPMPTKTPRVTLTPTAVTDTATPTSDPTSTPTNTPTTPSNTTTPTNVPTDTPTPTNTSTPTVVSGTPTDVPTGTLEPTTTPTNDPHSTKTPPALMPVTGANVSGGNLSAILFSFSMGFVGIGLVLGGLSRRDS